MQRSVSDFYVFRQRIISPCPSSEMQSTGERPCTQRDVPRTPSPPLPPSCSSPCARALLSQAQVHLPLQLSPHLPFISTLIEHAFNKPLEILTARLHLRFADSFCMRFKEQLFLPSHTQQLPPRDRSSHVSITARSPTLTKASCPADPHSES